MTDVGAFDELLIPRRAVLIDSEISEDVYKHVRSTLMRYALESADPVTILIDSEGGGVLYGLRLFDYIRAMPGPTKGVVMGKCWSIAIPILQACTERTATQHSTFILHEVRATVCDFKRSEKSSIAFILRENLQLQRLIEKTMLTRSRLTPPALRKLMKEGERHEVELFASRALQIGLIDRIVVQPFDSPPG